MKKPTTAKLSKTRVLVVCIVLVCALLAVCGWVVFRNNQVRSVSNFQECKDAPGSSVLLSYPEVCMTKDKKQFPNPDQQAPAPPVSKSTDLTFAEWGGIGISIPGQGATYTMNADGTAYVTTVELENLARSIQGCDSGLHGITIDRNFKEVPLAETMCIPAESAATQRIRAIRTDIRDALKSPATL